MAVYTVDTTDDTVDAGDGKLSLREALARVDATDEADTIRFSDQVQGGTIVLAGSQLTVASDVTIDGGVGVTIDANQQSRVLLVQDGFYNRNDVLLRSLTITGGRTAADGDKGGGILNAGSSTLTLDRSIVIGNATAGANAYGGGIAGYDIILSYSTVAENSTSGTNARGGGIQASNVVLTNSTVARNITTGDGASGGGIDATYLTLTNTTISANETLSADSEGGGIAVFSRIAVANSIVAGNAAGGGADPDIAGNVFSNGLNVFGSDVQGSAPSDRENVLVSALFAGGLADNGGPTPTLALLDDSSNPALGRADLASAPAADQRGVSRPAPDGTLPDIGAFELDQSDPSPPPMATTFIVTSAADVVADDGKLSLREALALADADSSTADRIEFAPKVQGQTISLEGGQLTANSDVTIDGGAGVIIDAHHASRVLLVQGLGTDARLQHLTVTGGRTSGYIDGGAGIRADRYTTLTLDDSTIRGNMSTGEQPSGGGISGSVITLNDSRVIHNSVDGHDARGGGILAAYGSITLNNSLVGSNDAHGRNSAGGAIAVFQANGDSPVTLNLSKISQNSATGYQSGVGGIDSAQIALSHSTVDGNRGGGVSGRTISVASSTIDGNHGIGAHGMFVTVSDSTISGNIGGIVVYGQTGGHNTTYGALQLNNSTISGNTTPGGVYAHGGAGLYFFISRAHIANSIIAGNSAAIGQADIDMPDAGATLVSNGHNIFGSAVEGAAVGDLQNVSASLLFAGGLARHGGPTETIALRDAPDNPALSSADPADSTSADQRGVARPDPIGTAPDIGAFESAWVAAIPQRPFDGLEYIATYPDLIRALGPDEAAGSLHFQQYGVSEGRAASFDGLEYIASYTDLIRQLGADRNAGSSHFISYGYDEARSITFDALEYIASYSDLMAAFGVNPESGSAHFIDLGATEGRHATFDGLQYIASYEDLIQALGANADAGASHYIGYGHEKGRSPDSFDAEQYLANHADLQAAFGDDIDAATVHFIRYGHAEGRSDEPLLAQTATDFLL